MTKWKATSVALLLAACSGSLSACDEPRLDSRISNIEGDPVRGRSLAVSYGCTACHQMPDIRARTGNVGPPLHRLYDRAYLAGRIQNTPGNTLLWIMDPTSFDPKTVMPNLRVTLPDAHDLVAFLYEAD